MDAPGNRPTIVIPMRDKATKEKETHIDVDKDALVEEAIENVPAEIDQFMAEATIWETTTGD